MTSKRMDEKMKGNKAKNGKKREIVQEVWD